MNTPGFNLLLARLPDAVHPTAVFRSNLTLTSDNTKPPARQA